MKEKLTWSILKHFLQTKLGIFTAIAVTAIVVGTGAIVYMNLQDEDFRSITVFELEGTATMTRNEQELAVYKGMQLTSGDSLTLKDSGYLRLLLDEDKYITLEPNTTIELLATGNSSDSHTKITLTSGSIVNEIQNELNSNSSYEVATPASTMAVRGTIFRVSAVPNEDGGYTVTVSVFEGSVGVKLILPDGTVLSDETLIETDRSAEIHSDTLITEFVFENAPINYVDLPKFILEQLIQWKQDNAVTEDDITIDELINLLNPKAPEKPRVPEKPKVPAEPEPEPETVVPPAPPVIPPVEPQVEPPIIIPPVEPPVEPPIIIPPVDPAPPAPPAPPASDSGNNDDNTPPPEEPPAPPVTFTVTFMNSMNAFATQTVVEGKTAKKPILSPTSDTNWYIQGNSTPYDFATPVTGNLTLYSPFTN